MQRIQCQFVIGSKFSLTRNSNFYTSTSIELTIINEINFDEKIHLNILHLRLNNGGKPINFIMTHNKGDVFFKGRIEF